MSATNGITIHHRNNRLGQATNLHLHIEHAQTGHTLFIYITSTTLYVHIATTAECMLYIGQSLTLGHLAHSTSKQYHTDVLHLAAHGKCLTQLPSGLGGKSIAIARTVNGNLSDTIILLEQNLLKLSYRLPVSHFSKFDNMI